MKFSLIIVPQVRKGHPEPFDKVAEQIDYAEKLGYDGLNVPEAVHDGLLAAAAALAATERLNVATSVLQEGWINSRLRVEIDDINTHLLGIACYLCCHIAFAGGRQASDLAELADRDTCHLPSANDAI